MVKYSFIAFFLIKKLLKVENASGIESTVSLFRFHNYLIVSTKAVPEMAKNSCKRHLSISSESAYKRNNCCSVTRTRYKDVKIYFAKYMNS